jgi:hypothetical protein
MACLGSRGVDSEEDLTVAGGGGYHFALDSLRDTVVRAVLLYFCFIRFESHNSSVGTVTGYGLDKYDLFLSGTGMYIFVNDSIPVSRSTQPSTVRVAESPSIGVKRP